MRALRLLPLHCSDAPKAEFRRHREVTNPVYIMGFLSQWKTYLDALPSDPNSEFEGKKLDTTAFEKVCSALTFCSYSCSPRARCPLSNLASCMSLCTPQKMSGSLFRRRKSRPDASFGLDPADNTIP